MAYTRITAVWNGASGLPGYTRLKFFGDLDAAACTAAAGRMRTFFDSIKTLLPSVISVGFQESAQVYDTNQTLTADVAFTPPAIVAGNSVGVFAAPTGMVVNWITGAVWQGRKIRGRSFIVPMSSSAFNADGTPGSASVTMLQGAAAALVAGTPPLCVAAGGDGAFNVSTVVGVTVPDRVAILRSRRD